MDLLKRIQLAWLRRREFLKAQAELESHSQRELAIDLRMNRSDIPDLAAEKDFAARVNVVQAALAALRTPIAVQHDVTVTEVSR